MRDRSSSAPMLAPRLSPLIAPIPFAALPEEWLPAYAPRITVIHPSDGSHLPIRSFSGEAEVAGSGHHGSLAVATAVTQRS
ncbi:hypothetical protein GCM10010411_71050 [Actinomadura fulvescens]|uniref:Uncharacterized protein n=1 Tax=Actinomadura fulvescens TaxID=46160 RepID=A0ABN3QEJ7_9ACTN